MKFYNQQHNYYCGIDLHARKMFVCILDQKGKTMVHESSLFYSQKQGGF